MHIQKIKFNTTCKYIKNNLPWCGEKNINDHTHITCELNFMAQINKQIVNLSKIGQVENNFPLHTLDNYTGCILGGAIGDALGAPVEFLSLDEIKGKYGEDGILELELGEYGDSEFTDDTQMTLFTVDGLIKDVSMNFDPNVIPNMSTIFESYKLWKLTQDNPASSDKQNGWIPNLSGLYSRKSPGYTCISALESNKMGTIEEPINHSKGCGGIMRVAPAALLYYENPKIAFETGARIAAITHGHPDAYLSAGVLCSIIAYIIQGNDIYDAISKSKEILVNYENHENTLEYIDKALMLSETNILPTEAIKKIGSGWTGEEALCIALYSILKAKGDFQETLKIAVNHDGDSDSAGAIAGSIAGAICGKKGIQNDWITKVEYSNVLMQVAKDLFEINTSQDISERYPYNKGKIPNWYSKTPVSNIPRRLRHIRFSINDTKKMKSMDPKEREKYKQILISKGKFLIY